MNDNARKGEALGTSAGAPYPPSAVIRRFRIHGDRISIGTGDCWPVTWADDGDLYVVYCDGEGWGERRFSMGMAKMIGMPPDISGENVPSPTGERGPDFTGNDKKGRKASGLIMVDGILYMWVRNLRTDGTGSSLAWSEDRARTWTWASWAFPDVGYPVWLNFGRDYAGARDDFLYFYSPNTRDAYAVVDQIIMGRVSKSDAATRDSYEFFRGLDAGGSPRWGADFALREPVFRSPARCYRPSVAYAPGIRRYLLCTATTAGHLGIFDAPEPWGPWTTVRFADDFGGPEDRFQPRIPPKWIDEDGRTLYLAYSCHPNGPYQFNVQRCTLECR